MRRVSRVVGLVVVVLFGAGLASAGAAPGARVELTFSDPDIVESSGLVARAGLVLTVNDSGDTGRVFAVDRTTGDTVGVTTWSDDPEDVEAIAPAGPDAPGEVWVADIGDNGAARSAVFVTRVPVGRGDRDVRDEMTTYELRYPRGAVDAETLMVDPASGRLVVVTKEIFGGQVLVAPARLDPDRPNRLREIGSATSIATDGSFWPDGRHLLVRGYATATVYAWPSLDVVGRFDLPDQMQGEGIAVDPDGVVLVSTEGARSDVLRVRLPGRIARAVAPPPPPEPKPSATASVAPDPDGTTPDLTASEPAPERSPWPWLVGGAFGVVVIGVLLRSLRPRG